MRNYNLPIIFGLATSVLVGSCFPAQAEAKVYKFVSGQANIRLDTEGLEKLESIGLSLASVENTAQPVPGYTYAFKLFPPNSEKSNFTFSYNDVTKEFIPLSGRIDLIGSLFFNVDTTKLALPPQLELGDLSAQPVVDLNVVDTITTGLPIFTLEPRGLKVDPANETLTLNFETLIAKEFSDFLVAAGATTPVEGLKFGELQEDRKIALVPEATNALGILIAVGAALAVVKQRHLSA
jgi:hypothetical protein